MVSELKDHLLRHLQGVEKKKIEQMVLDYVSKLVGLLYLLYTLPPTLKPWLCRFQDVFQYVCQIRFLELSNPQTSIYGAVD